MIFYQRVLHENNWHVFLLYQDCGRLYWYYQDPLVHQLSKEEVDNLPTLDLKGRQYSVLIPVDTDVDISGDDKPLPPQVTTRAKYESTNWRDLL